MNQEVLDKRFLTLPDWRTALKKRLRRFRPPSPVEISFLLSMVIYLYGAVDAMLRGHYVMGGVYASMSGYYWWAYHLARRLGKHPLVAICTMAGLFLSLLIISVIVIFIRR